MSVFYSACLSAWSNFLDRPLERENRERDAYGKRKRERNGGSEKKRKKEVNRQITRKMQREKRNAGNSQRETDREKQRDIDRDRVLRKTKKYKGKTPMDKQIRAETLLENEYLCILTSLSMSNRIG